MKSHVNYCFNFQSFEQIPHAVPIEDENKTLLARHEGITSPWGCNQLCSTHEICTMACLWGMNESTFVCNSE